MVVWKPLRWRNNVGLVCFSYSSSSGYRTSYPIISGLQPCILHGSPGDVLLAKAQRTYAFLG